MDLTDRTAREPKRCCDCKTPLPDGRVNKYCTDCRTRHMSEYRKDERWVLDRPYVADAIARAKRELRELKAARKLAAYDGFTDSRGTATA